MSDCRLFLPLRVCAAAYILYISLPRTCFPSLLSTTRPTFPNMAPTRSESTVEAKFHAAIAKKDAVEVEFDQIDGELDGAILGVVDKLTDEIAHTNSPEYIASIRAKLAGAKPEDTFPLLYWAPVVYVFLQYFWFQLPFDGLFWLHFIYMLTMTPIVVYLRTYSMALQLIVDEHNAFCVSKKGQSAAHVDKAASTIKVAGKRLTRYRIEYDEMKSKLRDAQNDLLTSQRDHAVSLESSVDAYHDCRKMVNRTRLEYFRSRHSHQQLLLDALDKLIRKFKNVSLPKVKGVSPKKSNSNGLTGPLERLATGLKNDQRVTEKQIKVGQKVQELLELDAEDWKETDRLIKKAEDSLGQAGAHAAASDVSVGSEMEVDLEKQFDRMEAYLRRTAKGVAARGKGDELAYGVTKS